MATVKKAKIKKAQRGISCGWHKPIKDNSGPGLLQRMRDRRDERKAAREDRRNEKEASSSKAGPLTKGSMWHPNDPEIYTKDPSASYWQERDYNEAKGVAKKVGDALKKPIMKKGGKVSAKKVAPKKSAPKKAAIKKSSKKK